VEFGQARSVRAQVLLRARAEEALGGARSDQAAATQRLPDIVTVEETERIFAATQVLSYRVFFFTLYSLGLRLGEGLRLTVADIDGARGRVHIRDAKGNKDRLVPLPTATYRLLRRFWQRHRNPVLLFPNRRGGLAGARRQDAARPRRRAESTAQRWSNPAG
jgi:integrase/recombinase XerD